MEFEIKTTIRLQSAPLDFACGDSSFMVIDSSYMLYNFMRENYKNISRIPLFGKNDKKIHPYSKLLSLGGINTLSVSMEGGNKVSVVGREEKGFQNKGSFSLGARPVCLNMIGKSGKYLLNASEGGEAGLIELSSGAQYCSFEKTGDYVCSAAMSADEKYAFISYFDKSGLFYDVYNKNEISSISTVGIVECAIFLDDKKICVYATRGGHIGIYDYIEQKMLTEKEHFKNWSSAMAIDESGNFVFIGTREGVLYVYSIQDDEIILSHEFESCGGITSIAVNGFEIIVGFVSADVYVIDMSHYLGECENFLFTKEYSKANQLLQKNSFLICIPSIIQKLQKEYEENKQKLLGMLAKNLINEAYELCRPFMRLKKISDEFDMFASQTAEIVGFMDMIEKKDFEQAYKIAYKSDVIRSLYVFESLEREFDNRINKVFTLLEESPDNKSKAIEIVKPFVKIPKKYEIIEQIFKNFDKFKVSKEIARQKNFAEYFELCEKYQFLKNTETYKKVIFAGENVLMKAQEYETTGMLEEALRYLKILQSFKPFAEKANTKIKELQTRAIMLSLCLSFDGDEIVAVKIYKLAESMPLLEYTDSFAMFHSKVKEKITEYEQRAHEIKPSDVEAAFGSLVNIRLLCGSFSSLMEAIYTAEINKNINNAEIDWDKTLSLFCSIFSPNAQMSRLIETLGAKITQSNKKPCSNFNYPNSILMPKAGR